MGQPSTLTHKFAAIQIKAWHIQFRMRQIFRNQEKLNEQSFSSNREKIKGIAPAIFNLIDMLVTLEYLQTLISDIFATPELKSVLNENDIKMLGKTKDLASRWMAVRNKLGGHIDIEIFEIACRKHKFRGALLSKDLETDMAIYNCLMLEAAVNETREKSDLFGRDLDFKSNFSGEVSVLVEKLNHDWFQAFQYFEPLIKRIYEIGKKEKIANTLPEDRQGLVVGD